MSIQETMQKHTAKDDPGGPHSRKKRFLSYPRFVELMVTADVKMVRHHGRNLEHYILTILSVVSEVFFMYYSLTHYCMCSHVVSVSQMYLMSSVYFTNVSNCAQGPISIWIPELNSVEKNRLMKLMKEPHLSDTIHTYNTFKLIKSADGLINVSICVKGI